MRIAVIDCFDSFTFNLVHYLEQMCEKVDCIRCDCVDISTLNQYDGIILSPGPGIPSETPKLYAILEEWSTTKPILGICLGHQAIGTYFGLELLNMPEVHHGINRPTTVVAENEILFRNIPSEFLSARYHSWVVSSPVKNSQVRITAIDGNGSVMGISHCQYNIKGVQFHPESILTDYGYQLLQNWVDSI